MKTHQLTKEQRELLGRIDFLLHRAQTFGGQNLTFYDEATFLPIEKSIEYLKTNIDVILKNGWYSKNDRNILNQLRTHFYNDLTQYYYNGTR